MIKICFPAVVGVLRAINNGKRKLEFRRYRWGGRREEKGGRRGVSKKPKVSGIIEERREEEKIPTEEQTETETSSAS